MIRYSTVPLIGAALLLSGCSPNVSMKEESVESAIALAGDYLVGAIRKDGMFVYRVNMNPRVKVKEKYNILRHGGTIYALCDYYQHRPDPKVKSVVERAGRYLQREAIHPVKAWDGTLAVWSEPDVNHSAAPRQAKLGGTGLGLVGLLSIEKIRPGFTSLADLRALGRFIVRMQKADGSFYSKYIPSSGGRYDKLKSLFYPGEAALGLLMLHEHDPSGNWRLSSTKALTYLARKRRGIRGVPADHWALLATAKLLALSSDELPQETRRLLIDHAVQICESMLAGQIVNSGKPAYDGGFVPDGRTTPTATRLEGLLAALRFLPAEHALRPRLREASQRGIEFLLRAQVKKGRFAGAFPRAVGAIDPNDRYAAFFNRRATEIRIDYIQHALSAMVEYQRGGSGEGPSAPR